MLRFLKPSFWSFLRDEWFVSDTTLINRRMAAMDRAAANNRRERESRPWQNLYCVECVPPRLITRFSDENDYICDIHSFVTPVREDGKVIAGDGRPGPPRVIGVYAGELPK